MILLFPIYSLALLSQEVFFKGEDSYLIKVLNQNVNKSNHFPMDIVIFDSEKNYLNSFFSLSLNKLDFFNKYFFYKLLNLNDKWDFFPLKREGIIIGYISILNNIPLSRKWEFIIEALVYIGYID